LNSPSYLPVIVPAIGMLVPFVIRWIENRSRLKQARHLLDVIKTRDEIEKLISDAERQQILLPEVEASQLRHYRQELDKEIKRSEGLDIRLYPLLISLEIIFFVSAAFTGMLGIFQKLFFSTGNDTFPFLEGIFSNTPTRIGLLIICLIISLYFTHFSARRIAIRIGINLKSELQIFTIFNLYFLLVTLSMGTILYLLDLVMPWF